MLACVTSGGKVLACGAGASASDAQLFAALCVAGFERDRPELAAVALVSDGGLLGTVGATGSGGNATQYLARQIRALGQPGDLLLVLSATGNDVAVLEALDAAHERDMMAVVLTGRTGGSLAGRVRETDVLICVPHDRAARVRETHTLVLHCLCDGVDAQLLGEQEMPL
jgi:D-sedoheptulose 7-phosphate isomerase